MSTAVPTRPSSAAEAFDRPASPPARRLAPAKWKDARLVIGLLLVALSVFAGARVVSAADDTVPVWALRHDLGAGTTLTASDLEQVRVHLDRDAPYLFADTASAPVGKVLTHALGGGELVPSMALSSGRSSNARLVTVPIEQFHAPSDLARGDKVDVYATPRADAGGSGAASLVLAGAVVDSVEGSGAKFGTSSRATGVVLAVDPESVSRVVSGLRKGSIDLVRSPGGAQ